MAKIRVIESFDPSFSLTPETEASLFTVLAGERFLVQVAEALGVNALEFTGMVFQPVPYSTTTPKGMPAEFEIYHESKDYAIVNVPPNFMFQAKVFKPSRLCAIYRIR